MVRFNVDCVMVACRDYIQKAAIFQIKCMLGYTTKDMDIPNRKYMNRPFNMLRVAYPKRVHLVGPQRVYLLQRLFLISEFDRYGSTTEIGWMDWSERMLYLNSRKIVLKSIC